MVSFANKVKKQDLPRIIPLLFNRLTPSGQVETAIECHSKTKPAAHPRLRNRRWAWHVPLAIIQEMTE